MLSENREAPVTAATVSQGRNGVDEKRDGTASKPFPEYDQEVHRQIVLSQLRSASLQYQLIATDVDTIGVALRNNAIDVEQALTWVANLDDPLGIVIADDSAVVELEAHKRYGIDLKPVVTVSPLTDGDA